MGFQESPAQRQRREQKESLFGLLPLFGPGLPEQPGFKKSSSQQKRDDAKKAFFETKDLRKTSLPDVAAAFTGSEQTRMKDVPVTGGKTVIEAPGKTGSVRFIDCDGAQTGFIEWENGRMLTEGDQVIQGGCSDSSSYP